MNILKRPMFYAAMVCCIAAVLSLFIKSISFILLLISIIIFSFIIFKKNYKYIVVTISIILFFLSLIFQFAKIDNVNKQNTATVKGKFLVCNETVPYEKFNMITFKVIDCPNIPKNTKILSFDYSKTKLNMGDIVIADLKISAIDKYDEYRLSDYGNGIYATANVKKIESVKSKNIIYKISGKIRAYVKDSISSFFEGDTAGLLCAITTGDRNLLGDDFLQNIKTTGVSHVVVVSGMHLSIIMAAVFFVVDRLFYNKYVRALLTCAVIILITAVCGFTMSVIRAGVAFVIAGLAPVFNRDNDSLSSLLTAITVILISAPFAIVNISFLLSVLSTLAIIWVVPFYSKLLFKKFKINSKIIKTLIQLILCCVFANIFTLPVAIKTFGYISLVSSATNILITYAITAALIFNIVAVVLSAIPIINYFGDLCFWIAGFCAKFTVFIINKIASLRITVAVLPKSTFWLSILLILVVILFMYYCEAKIKKREVI